MRFCTTQQKWTKRVAKTRVPFLSAPGFPCLTETSRMFGRFHLRPLQGGRQRLLTRDRTRHQDPPVGSDRTGGEVFWENAGRFSAVACEIW
jgi:hypothetical protein